MINNTQSLSMAEAQEFAQGSESTETDAKGFIKKFTKMDVKTAKLIREKLEALDLMKIKPEHISKIIDLMPEDEVELNKIFVDVGLDEDEIKNILETIKEFK